MNCLRHYVVPIIIMKLILDSITITAPGRLAESAAEVMGTSQVGLALARWVILVVGGTDYSYEDGSHMFIHIAFSTAYNLYK